MPRFLFSLFLAALLFASPAMAQDIDALINRMDRVERDMQNLSMEVFKGTGKSAPASGGSQASAQSADGLNRLDARLSALEDNMRELTGKIEELRHAQNQLAVQHERYVSDAELRFQTLESKLTQLTPDPNAQAQQAQNAQTAQNQQPVTPLQNDPAQAAATAQPQPPAPIPNANAGEVYEKALTLLQQANYVGAEAAFKQFLTQFPDHRLSSNAQYWLAETYYVRGNYGESAVEFLKSYQTYPKAIKAPDSLLKLGLSLSQLNNKAEACTTLAKLSKEFPRVNPQIKQRANTEITKLQCGQT